MPHAARRQSMARDNGHAQTRGGHKVNAQEAKSFGGYSMTNAMILTGAAAKRGCHCKPYEDWFTYKRWQAQSYQVKRGEHGVRLSTFVTMTKIDDNGNKVVVGKRPWKSVVFCRCQVEEATT